MQIFTKNITYDMAYSEIGPVLGQYLTTSLQNPGLYSTIEEINYMYYFQIYSDNLDCFYIKENMTRMPKTLAKRDWVHTKKPANTFQNYTSIQVI